jgi:hypothetical protein
MAKRAIKTIRCSYHDAEKENGLIDKFLNTKETGEIYEIKTNGDTNNNDVFYTFFYEKLEIDDIENKAKVNQRKLKEIKESKPKPKLL